MSEEPPDLFGWRGKTLAEAKREFWDNVAEGTKCPCCNRYGRVYRRRLNSGMAWWLIRFFRHCEENGVNGDYVDIRTVKGGIEKAHKCEFEKLAYWGLVEKLPAEKEEGHASGFWRITKLGRDFVLRRAQVLSHALDYDGGSLELQGATTGIIEALHKKFDYDELMSGE